MSVAPQRPSPMGDAPARAKAKETLWRLAALAFGHPTPAFHNAAAAGRFQKAFGDAWSRLLGRPWPCPAACDDFGQYEAGYISAFLHGQKGKPVAALLAGDHERILEGLTRPVFMLNLTAFYKHFGLKAATADEGRNDEPDHLAGMLEFMAVLSFLEARALADAKDPTPYRRAQRDFLSRYLAPTLGTIAGILHRHPVPGLDAMLLQLVQDLDAWARQQIAELEARVGPFHDPNAAADATKPSNAAAEPMQQNLWG